MTEQTNQTPLNFMRYRPLYFVISALIIIPGIVSLIIFGLEPSIDFTGGSLIEIEVTQGELEEASIRETIPENIEISTIQQIDEDQFLIRSAPLTSDQNQQIQSSLASAAASQEPAETEGATPSAQVATPSAYINELRFETVGPILGEELIQKTLASVVLAAGAILLYIAYRFNEIKYGVTAIIAMFHDTFILLGVFSILGHYFDVQVDTLFVTAVLTTLSFSVHDTIVVYDRIRESLEKHPKANFIDLTNKAVAETLARSINNSMTIIFMLLALWLLGGETIKWFVFALLIGTIAGTYSSTFTATPLLVVWHKYIDKRS